MKLEVTASRDGRFWYLESTQIDGLTTQARTVAEIPEMDRDLAAMVLKRQGVTVRDIGAVLGVSHQRAQQLVTH